MQVIHVVQPKVQATKRQALATEQQRQMYHTWCISGKGLGSSCGIIEHLTAQLILQKRDTLVAQIHNFVQEIWSLEFNSLGVT